MTLNIGEAVKRLRKEREITQEELALQLGVSCQSVSRWENQLCYPDIEMIPVIAAFFGVSTDHLLGVDEALEAARVDAYSAQFQAAISVGDIDECIRIARNGLAEYPNNYVLLNKLMYALFVSTDSDGNIADWQNNRERYDEEIVALGERIVQYCPDDDIRFEAIARLAFHHCEMERYTIGRAIYQKLPTVDRCRETYQWWSLRDEEKLPFAYQWIQKSYHQLNMALGVLAQRQLIPDEEAVEVMKRRFAIDELMEDDKVPLFCIAESHYELAKLYARLEREDDMFEALTTAANGAKAFDARPDTYTTVSLLQGEITRQRTDFDTADTRSACEILRDTWLQDNDFDPYRHTTRFQALIGSL